jgi:hypothetical protein
MKALVIGPQYPDSFARNIAVALERMGFQVSTGFPELMKGRPKRKVLDFLSARVELLPRLRNWLQRSFVRAAAKTKPDLVLVTCGELTPPTIKELRQVAPAVAAWYPDPTANLAREYLLASDFHCVFFKEPRAVALFRKNLDMPAYFLPECCNPIWHRPQDCTSEESSRFGCDVALAGNCYYYRLRMIEGLRGFDDLSLLAGWATTVILIPTMRADPVAWAHPILTSGHVLLCAFKGDQTGSGVTEALGAVGRSGLTPPRPPSVGLGGGGHSINRAIRAARPLLGKKGN